MTSHSKNSLLPIMLVLFFSCNLHGLVMPQVGNVYAQDPQLFDNTWYLHKLAIANDDHFPPLNSEVPYVDMNFFNDNSGEDFETNVCNTFFGELVYTGTQSFSIALHATTLIFCNLDENNDFEIIYFSSFFQGHIQDVFNYTITNNGNDKTLTITNSSGDQAIYGSELLSVNKFDTFNYTFFPNPVQDILHFESKNRDLSEVKITVRNLNGQQVGTESQIFSGPDLSISTQEWNTGIYFVTVKNGDGSVQSFKVIKK